MVARKASYVLVWLTSAIVFTEANPGYELTVRQPFVHRTRTPSFRP
ncbi:hypothetical protein ACXC9Q_00255 [Kribbella sp. CWNU-51]